jgi:dynein heavy chain 1, cytosolic
VNVKLVSELEQKLSDYKRDYATLIADVERIKKETDSVLDKCSRANKLMEDLSGEKKRWTESSATFESQLSALNGDTLLSAAFLGYIGFFDHFFRIKLLTKWRNYLENIAQIIYTDNLSIADYLVNPAMRLRWVGNGLPDDQLCTENAIILKCYQR